MWFCRNPPSKMRRQIEKWRELERRLRALHARVQIEPLVFERTNMNICMLVVFERRGKRELYL